VLASETADSRERLDKLVNDQPQAPETMTQDNPTCTVTKNNPGQGKVDITGYKITNEAMKRASTDFYRIEPQASWSVAFDDTLEHLEGEVYIYFDSDKKVLVGFDVDGGNWALSQANVENGTKITIPSGHHISFVFCADSEGWNESFIRDVFESKTAVISKKKLPDSFRGNVIGTQATSHIAFDVRQGNLVDVTDCYTPFPTSLTITPTETGFIYDSAGVNRNIDFYMPTIIGEEYYLNYESDSPINVQVKEVVNSIATTNNVTLNNGSFVAVSNITAVRFYASDTSVISISEFSITKGTTPPIEYPKSERTVLYTGENVTEKNKRTHHEDGTLECEDNEKHEVLDGNAGDWLFHGDEPGWKKIKIVNYIKNRGGIESQGTQAPKGSLTKYNGKNIIWGEGTAGADRFNFTYGDIYISIADADSGFAEGFTDITPEMIAAILNGWVIYKYGTNLAYDGVGSFAFSKRYQGIGTKFDMPFGTAIETNTSLGENIIPTEKAYGSVTRCWSIWYDLAKPDIYTKQLPPLQLGSGVTHVTALTGRVKDLIKPVLNAAGTHYVVNHVLEGATLTEPCKRIVDIIKKKGDIEDTDLENWGVSSDQYAYGDQRQSILVSDYDKDAAYYFEYDTVAESTNCGVFTAKLDYTDNLVKSVGDLLDAVGELSEAFRLSEMSQNLANIEFDLRLTALET